MKASLALVTVVVLSVWSAACGGAGKGTASAPQPSSRIPTGSATGTVRAATQPVENDDHIRTYGHEASGAERRMIVALVKRYYADVAAGDGAAACGLLNSSLAKAVPEDYGQPPGPPALRGKTCAAVMSKLSRYVPGQPTAVLAATKVTGVRLRGAQGFVQLSSTAMRTGEIAIAREGSSWKVEVLIGRACTECAAG
jgi:hypothetical protein